MTEVLFFSGNPRQSLEVIVKQFPSYEKADKYSKLIAPKYSGLSDTDFWCDVRGDKTRFESWNLWEWLRETDRPKQ